MFSRYATSIVCTSIAAFLLLRSGVSLADSACRLDGDRSIPLMIQQFDRLDELLPPVPHDQNQAMEAQERLGLMSGLDARDAAGAGKALSDLKNNPYYYLRQSRIALKKARDAVSIILVDAKSLLADKYIGLGVPSRFYKKEYADPNAVKLDHAGFAVGPVAALELALREYLPSEQQRTHPNLAPATRAEIELLASGYTGNLGRYMQCKLMDVTTNQRKRQVATDGASKAS